MRNLFSRLRSYFFYDPLAYLYTAMMGAGSLTSSLFDRSGRIQHWFARMWAKAIIGTVNTPVEVIDSEKLNLNRPAVYVMNHISALDIPAIFAVLPFQFRIMAKKELFRYPVLGWHLKRSGQIAIDRDNARASMKSLIHASETLKSGMPLMVFPEGGRSEDGHIKPFLGGSFYVAIRAGAPVVPLALVGTFEALPMNSFHVRPRPIKLVVGEAIDASKYNPREMDKLAAEAQQAVEDMYYRYADVPRPTAAPAKAPTQAQFSNTLEEAGNP